MFLIINITGERWVVVEIVEITRFLKIHKKTMLLAHDLLYI